jgi:hypothetical protein
MGYAETGEGISTKQEHKYSDTRNEDQEDESEEQEMGFTPALQTTIESRGLARSRSEQGRDDSKPSSIMDNNQTRLLRESSAMADPGRGTAANFGNDYRESAVYSDDDPSPVRTCDQILYLMFIY